MKSKPELIDSPVVRIIAPTAALATGLLSQAALAAPGDLDPSFGDVGRVRSPADFYGRVWAVEGTEDGDVLFGGYDDYCYYSCVTTGFVGRLDGDGALDAGFAAAVLADFSVYDVVMLPDGRAVGLGSNRSANAVLQVFRLNPDGSLDGTFGTNGIVQLGAEEELGYEARSMVLEPDGQLAIAAIHDARLVVVRLLADGALDPGFGDGGVFTGPTARVDRSLPAQILRAAGGYRVSFHAEETAPSGSVPRCQVVGLTFAGALDAAFGSGGTSAPVANGEFGDRCASMVAQADGRLLLAGTEHGADGADQAFIARLQSSGVADPGFSGAAVAEGMRQVTALAVDERDTIAVAGRPKTGLPGGLIVRLQADGLLDSVFGEAGSTPIDLPSQLDGSTDITALEALPGGGLLVGGGEGDWWYMRPFVVRLLGDDAGGGPGVLDVEVADVAVVEADQQAVVTVRRIGGRSGPVSVAYETVEQGWQSPNAGTGDFTAVQGRLDWADGETGSKSIVVPVVSDGPAIEGSESFSVVLSAPEGGAGIADATAWVTIHGDGYPAGQFTIEASSTLVLEGRGASANLVVSRNWYSEGPVSVTVRTASGSATAGVDFDAAPITLHWDAWDSSQRTVRIRLIEDQLREPNETFTVSLSDPTGGAVVATVSPVTFTIADRQESGGSGGGGLGGAAALLLGLGAALRRLRTKR